MSLMLGSYHRNCRFYSKYCCYYVVVNFAAQLKNASNLISCITTKEFEKIVDFIMQRSFQGDLKVLYIHLYSLLNKFIANFFLKFFSYVLDVVFPKLILELVKDMFNLDNHQVLLLLHILIIKYIVLIW